MKIKLNEMISFKNMRECWWNNCNDMHTCMMVWGYKNVHLYICNLYGKCVIYFSSVSWKLYHMLYLLKSYKQHRHTVTATWRLHLCVHVKYGIQMKQLNEFRNVRVVTVRTGFPRTVTIVLGTEKSRVVRRHVRNVYQSLSFPCFCLRKESFMNLC